MDYLIVLAGGLAFLFFLILLTNRGKRTEHWFLTTLFSLIIVNCYFVFCLMRHDGEYYAPVFSEFNYAIPMLYGVLLWFYTRSLVTKDFQLVKSDLLHLIPFTLFFGYLIILMMVDDQSNTVSFLGYPLIKLIVNPVYIFLTLKLLHDHRTKLFQQYSHVDHMHHYWLTWITYGALLLWIVACLGNIFNWYNDFDHNLTGDYLLIGFLSILLFLLAIVGFNRTQIFQSAQIEHLYPQEFAKIETEHAEDGDQQLKITYDHIDQMMTEERLYLDPTLSLHKLATTGNVSAAKLSMAINQVGGKNFYDYVNDYRVQEVKKRLAHEDLEKYSILGIAEECGFNSKASFNRIFKKRTGMTPTQFIKKEVS